MSLKKLASRVLERVEQGQQSRIPSQERLEQRAEHRGLQSRRKPHVPRSTSKGTEQRNRTDPTGLCPDWSDEQLVRERFEERAAIIEEGCGVSADIANARAYECLIVDWLNDNPPVQANPDLCAGCKRPLDTHGWIPVLNGGGGHVSLHDACWESWIQHRRKLAEEALAHLRS